MTHGKCDRHQPMHTCIRMWPLDAGTALIAFADRESSDLGSYPVLGNVCWEAPPPAYHICVALLTV